MNLRESWRDTRGVGRAIGRVRNNVNASFFYV